MVDSAQDQVEAIVRRLENKGTAAAPAVAAINFAASHPSTIIDLANAVIRRFPKGGTFLDAALSYLPHEDWPRLVQEALGTLEKESGRNEAAESVIAYASLQSVSTLHPHLSRIFELRPNLGTYYEMCPWTESGEQHIGFLRNVIESSSNAESRRRAWIAMLQTRHPRVIDFALDHPDPGPGFCPTDDWVRAHLHLVGFRQDNESLQRLCRDDLFHLCFPESFFEGESRPPWLARIHPTWSLNSESTLVLFGGSSEAFCSHCKERLHRLIVFDPIPQGLAITGLTRLEIATCLSCLGWEQQHLFYRHDPKGVPVNIGYEGPQVTPELPVGPLKRCEVQLTLTPERWRSQDWALSNSRENLNRVGGEPCWIQDADYPSCPWCNELMPYLLQLDSGLPTEEGEEWLWGSGGIGYVFWCDDCKVSGLHWQCT